MTCLSSLVYQNKGIMKEFNLEDAKAGKAVQTRSGRSVRIIAFDRKNNGYPIIALITDINGEEESDSYTNKGRLYTTGLGGDEGDLMMTPEKKKEKRYRNLYGTLSAKRSSYFGHNTYTTKKEARKEGRRNRDYLTTIRVDKIAVQE